MALHDRQVDHGGGVHRREVRGGVVGRVRSPVVETLAVLVTLSAAACTAQEKIGRWLLTVVRRV